MKNTEKAIRLLVGNERVTGRDSNAATRAAYQLNILIAKEGEERIKAILDEMEFDRTSRIINLVQALIVAEPNDCELVFSELLAMLKKLTNEHKRQELSYFYHGVIVGLITIIVWLEREKQLTSSAAEKFFEFLLDFILIPSSVSHCEAMQSYFSGMLSNVSGPLCKIEGAGKFFRLTNKRWTTNMSVCAEQILTELCLKRYIMFSLEDKVKISSSHSPSK